MALWERIKDAVVSHPYWTAGLTLGLVILIYFYTRSSPAAAPSSGVFAQSQDPNVVAANAAQAISQNQTNAAVDVNNVNTAAAQAIAAQGIAAQLSANQTNQQTALAALTIQQSTALSALQSTNASAVTVAGLQAGVANNSISAQAQLANHQINQQVTLAQISARVGLQDLAAAAAASSNSESSGLNISNIGGNFGTAGGASSPFLLSGGSNQTSMGLIQAAQAASVAFPGGIPSTMSATLKGLGIGWFDTTTPAPTTPVPQTPVALPNWVPPWASWGTPAPSHP